MASVFIILKRWKKHIDNLSPLKGVWGRRGKNDR